MKIIASYDSTVNSAPAGYKAAVQAAIAYVQAAFVSNITVNITFSYSGAGLGSSSTAVGQFSGSQVISALQNIPASSAALPTSIPSVFTTTQMNVALPLARQLGLTTDAPASDATVYLSPSATWNWDPSVTSVANGYGAFTTLVHEITEALGRACGSDGTFENSPLALFRYTAPGVVSTNGQAAGGYFSMNQGTTNLISMGNSGGDLADFNSTTDAFGTGSAGTADQVSQVDLQEMQVIGYTLSTGDLFGGGNSVTFGVANNNSALLANSGTNWDVANGSNGTVMLTNDQAAVVGGDDQITFIAGLGTTRDTASLYNTGGNADTVTGSGGVIALVSAQANISGGGEQIYFNGNAADAVTLSNTSAWDLLNGSNGSAKLVSAQAAIVGGGDTVTLDGSTSDIASLFSTSNSADTVAGSNGTVALTNAQAIFTGASNVVYLDGNSADAATFSGAGASWNTVYGASGTININGGASANVVGAGDTINFDSTAGNTVSLYSANSPDTVNGSNGVVAINSTQGNVQGGGDTVYLLGTNAVASISATAGSSDAVIGSSQQLVATGAQATLTGSSDLLRLYSGSTITLSGTSERVQPATTVGLSQVSGFVSSDTVDLSNFSQWGSFASFQSSGAMTQNGADTQIKFDASDILTLKNVTASTLTASNFSFAVS